MKLAKGKAKPIGFQIRNVVAIYHFSAQIISRSQGRSSVAAAAYRAGEKLVDERTGLTHDFTNKNDIIKCEIMLPSNAPKWMKNRAKLWNEVEQVEKRKDAQLAREINIALPKELSKNQNWDLAKSFVQKEFVDKGMVVDVAFHRGHQAKEEQPHLHLMVGTREVSEDGFGQKNREWNSKDVLNNWRENWAEYCNLALAKNGIDMRIDNRTLEAQGINLEPQSKIGPASAKSRMARFVEHQELARRNGERLQKNPEIAFKALTNQHATFTHRDIAKFVNRHTSDYKQFQEVYAKVMASPELVLLGKDDNNVERYSAKSMLQLESKMLTQADALARSATHAVSPEVVEKIEKKFAKNEKPLFSDQAVALKHITQGADLACVEGYAGTGKSYMLKAAREIYESQGYKVHGMALSGIAAENLQTSSGINSRTAASYQWYWDRGSGYFSQKDVVVIDEAGMLGTKQLARIVDEVAKAGAKCILAMDREQLQAIQAGGAGRAILERHPPKTLSTILRQDEPWQKKATINFATQKTSEGLKAYFDKGHIHSFDTKPETMNRMIERWDESRQQNPNESHIMCAFLNKEVDGLNSMAREMRHRRGELGKDVLFVTSKGEKAFAVNDRIFFLKNERYDMNVKNGTLGTIENIKGNNIKVRLDSEHPEKSRVVSFSAKDYNHITHGYAATIHKLQGTTVHRSFILASKYLDRFLTYVAATRHKISMELFYSKDEHSSLKEMHNCLSRGRPKDMATDHIKSHDINPESKGYIRESIKTGLKVFHDKFNKVLQKEALQAGIKKLEEKFDVKVSMKANDGERGIYQGSVKIAGNQYGFIKQDEKNGLLIPVDRFDSRELGEKTVIELKTNSAGRNELKAIQPNVLERNNGPELSL